MSYIIFICSSAPATTSTPPSTCLACRFGNALANSQNFPAFSLSNMAPICVSPIPIPASKPWRRYTLFAPRSRPHYFLAHAYPQHQSLFPKGARNFGLPKHCKLSHSVADVACAPDKGSSVCVCTSLGHEIRGSQPNCCRLVRTVSFVVMHQLSLQGSGACCWSHHSTKTLLQHGDMESGRCFHVPAWQPTVVPRLERTGPLWCPDQNIHVR